MQLIQTKTEKLSANLNYKEAIEVAGRVCYKSENRITKDSCDAFVTKLIEKGHTAMLEHGTIYLKIPLKTAPIYLVKKYYFNQYSVSRSDNYNIYITTNYRVLVENDWLDDLEYICECTEYHEKRISFQTVCSRAIANQLVRHRAFSFAQESTCYCNYSKDKFHNELTFIKPNWYNIGEKTNTYMVERSIFDSMCNIDEEVYLTLVKTLTPQLSRDILPLALKTEIVMTGFEHDWYGFFKLRGSNSSAHPDMRILAEAIKSQI